MEYFINCEMLMDKESSHNYLKEVFSFPKYYGNNLDALYDCISELEECTIWFENMENAGEYLDPVYEVVKDASEENENITVREAR